MALVLGISAVALTTKRDFSFLGGLLKIGGFVALGLIVASFILPISLGLWFSGAMVAFVGFGFLLRNVSTMRLALIALGVAWAVEFSQLYHAPWIDTIRSTRLGKLVLGSTFNWSDLLAYAIGIAVSAFMEHLYRKPRLTFRSTWDGRGL